jgi:hypothetical protein
VNVIQQTPPLKVTVIEDDKARNVTHRADGRIVAWQVEDEAHLPLIQFDPSGAAHLYIDVPTVEIRYATEEKQP